MGRRVALEAIVVDDRLKIRDSLNENAVARYCELYESGQTKALVVQKGTMRLLDGHHRLEAARRAGLVEVWVEEREVSETDLLAEVFRCNRAHGVPLSTAERDNVVRRLYYQVGWTQAQIAELVGLSQQAISRILAVRNTTGCNVDTGDKRFRLRDEDMPAIVRLLLAGASHEEVAERFGVARSTVTTRWNEFRDAAKSAYESGLLKREVAARFSLTVGEVDAILRQYDPEPVNFTPSTASLWTGFTFDERFGRRYPGNTPALLVKSILYYYSRPSSVILDPCAGGGAVLDAAADMVGRKVYGFDLFPTRPEIQAWDLLAGPPPVPEEPDVIFLDPPYGPAKQGEYPKHPSQLADMEIGEFLSAMQRVFGYWRKGRVILLMACLRRDGQFVALPYECAKRLEAQGWRLMDWLVNEINRPASETAVAVAAARKHRVPLRSHIDVLVAEKP